MPHFSGLVSIEQWRASRLYLRNCNSMFTTDLADSLIHCSILEDAMDMDDAVDSGCLRLPETCTLGPKEIAKSIGLASFTSSLANKKKRSSAGHQASHAEEVLLGYSLHQCQNVGELDRNFQQHEECRPQMRSFYSSSKQCASKRRLELTECCSTSDLSVCYY